MTVREALLGLPDREISICFRNSTAVSLSKFSENQIRRLNTCEVFSITDYDDNAIIITKESYNKIFSHEFSNGINSLHKRVLYLYTCVDDLSVKNDLSYILEIIERIRYRYDTTAD